MPQSTKDSAKETTQMELRVSRWFKEISQEFCEVHGLTEFANVGFGGKNQFKVCLLCNEEKTKMSDEISADKIKREAYLKRAESLAVLAIPKRFEAASFDNFDISQERPKRIFEVCKSFAVKFPECYEKGASLAFLGSTGTGKTHLAYSIAKYVILHHNKSVRLESVFKAIREVKQSYSKDNKISESAAISKFVTPDLLILDELGLQFGTEAEKLILFEILNERYERMKPTIMISNLTLNELKDYVGERIIDRMKENGGKVLTFDWKSYRGTGD